LMSSAVTQGGRLPRKTVEFIEVGVNSAADWDWFGAKSSP
jgi:hypothetical protein